MPYALAFAALAVACSASGTTTGGNDRFDAAPPEPPPATGDGGAGATWTELYADFFGAKWPDGPGCAGNEQCHGGADQPGARASNYVCGHSKDECYAGITSANAALMNTADPASSGLVAILRHRNGGQVVGAMPFQPTTYVFSDSAIQRIEAWMRAGAKND